MGLPSHPNETFVKNNPHLYGGVVSGDEKHLHKIGALLPHQGKRLRQDSKPLMNKLETELFNYLQRLYPKVKFHAQAKRYKLANGLWYKPDITAVMDGQEFAWEAKGPHAFRGGFENLKFAATAWPEVNWTLIWKDGNGWRSQKILP
jgi:hypothetical protein